MTALWSSRTCLLLVLLIPAMASAQAEVTDASAALRRDYLEVSDWITRSAELVPADQYAYRPVATVRTFGELVGHVIDGYNYFCGRAAGRTMQWSDPVEKGVTTKAELVAALRKATEECTVAYGAGPAGPLSSNIGHSSLHYGNMVTYIRMMGLVPPQS